MVTPTPARIPPVTSQSFASQWIGAVKTSLMSYPTIFQYFLEKTLSIPVLVTVEGGLFEAVSAAISASPDTGCGSRHCDSHASALAWGSSSYLINRRSGY